MLRGGRLSVLEDLKVNQYLKIIRKYKKNKRFKNTVIYKFFNVYVVYKTTRDAVLLYINPFIFIKKKSNLKSFEEGGETTIRNFSKNKIK